MGWMVNIIPRPQYPGNETLYPLCRRLGGFQGRSGRLRKILPPPEFDHRTFHPVITRYVVYSTGSLKFLRWKPPKMIVHIPRNPCPWKRKKNYKDMVVSARRLLHYFQFPDKNSRDISRNIYKFLPHFNTVMYLFHHFSPNSERCSSERSLRNTGLRYPGPYHKYDKTVACFYSWCKVPWQLTS
jgi:hypothetical protein